MFESFYLNFQAKKFIELKSTKTGFIQCKVDEHQFQKEFSRTTYPEVLLGKHLKPSKGLVCKTESSKELVVRVQDLSTR